MKRVERQIVFSSLLLGSLLASLGCSGSTAAGDPGTGTSSVASAQGTRVAAVAPSVKSSRVRMIADALSTVPLRDEQRAEIEALASDADARHAAAAGARAEIMNTLAAQIEGGQIDRAALQPKIDAAADAANAARPADQAALQRLHALLTAEQRGQVADALAARRDAMHAEHGHTSRKDRMNQWAADLKLTDAQRAQIGAVLASQRGEHRAEWKAPRGHDHDGTAHGGHPFADSFRADTLVLPPPEDGHVHANAMTDHFVGLAQGVLPILTPEQRALAAAKLREHAAAGAANEDAPLTE
jgi:Spy/CpxP family protein refolding chaperone